MKIYHTPTQEDYDDLMKKLEKEGLKTLLHNSPTTLNNWKHYKSSTCVEIEHGLLGFSPIDFYRKAYPNIEIIEYKKENKMKQEKEILPKKIMKFLDEHWGYRLWYLLKEMTECGDYEISSYALEDTNVKNIIQARELRYKHEKEVVGYIRAEGQESVVNKWDDGSYDFNTRNEYYDCKTKFTKEEFENFKNSLVWEEIEE